MSTRFVKQHPLVRRSEKERMMVLGAVGLTFTLILLMVILLHNRSDASVRNDARQAQVDQVRPAIGSVALMVPSRDIPAGTKLSPDAFKEAVWPRNHVPEGAVRDVATLVGMYSKSSLVSGQPVLRAALSSQPTSGPLPVTPGFRAVTIEVDATSSLEGHALPGSRVDVLLTFVKENEKTTKVIVQNARILSAGGQSDKDMENLPPAMRRQRVQNSTVTLEVLPTDALKIQTAKSMGKLGLMMRSQDDNVAPEVTEINERNVGDGSAARAQPNLRQNCSRGSVRMEGREYAIGCDGSLSMVVNPNEP